MRDLGTIREESPDHLTDQEHALLLHLVRSPHLEAVLTEATPAAARPEEMRRAINKLRHRLEAA